MENNIIVLAEKPYAAVQGEGTYVGLPMLFVRLQGCNVGCEWCDSYYTWFPYNTQKVPDILAGAVTSIPMTLDELHQVVVDSGVKHVWITGGEPTLQATALKEYFSKFRSTDVQRYHICTAGWVWNEFLMRVINSIVIDVKPPSSKTSSKKEFIQKCIDDVELRAKTQLKIVVDNTDEDKAFAIEVANNYSRYVPITLQPKYISEPQVMQIDVAKRLVSYSPWKLEEYANWYLNTFSKSENVRLGLQLHKHLYPKRTRGI